MDECHTVIPGIRPYWILKVKACAAKHHEEGALLAELATSLSLPDCKELLLFVMESAQRIALEPRPEVRTSGIKLLFDIMTRHSVALADEEGRVWDMAFPLLMEVVKNVQLSDEAHSSSNAPTETNALSRGVRSLSVHQVWLVFGCSCVFAYVLRVWVDRANCVARGGAVEAASGASSAASADTKFRWARLHGHGLHMCTRQSSCCARLEFVSTFPLDTLCLSEQPKKFTHPLLGP
jgi:hypothetical protein